MSSYTKCDMCGCVITESFFAHSLQIRRKTKYAANIFECDLCADCAKILKDLIKKERKANEHVDQKLE